MNDYKANICANITYLRKIHNLSRNAMSKLIHVSPKTLAKMEQGIFPGQFRLAMLYRTGAAFHLDPDDLMRPLKEE